jgi:hypothetical protein
MNTVVIEVAVRRDGRRYPPRPLTRAERNKIRWLEHDLCHRDGLSIRAAQQAMAERGIRRSVGAIHRDLVAYECGICAGLTAAELAETPAPGQDAPPVTAPPTAPATWPPQTGSVLVGPPAAR